MAREAANRKAWLLASGGLAVLVAASTAVALTLGSSAPQRDASGTRARPTASTTPPTPITVNTISPPSGASEVALTSPIAITFSAPLARSSPDPLLSPAVRGVWSRPKPTELEFVPTGRFLPAETVKVTIPSGDAGVLGVDGAALSTAFGASFTTATVSTLRLDQLLAELDYLPVAFVPESAAATTSPGATAAGKVAPGGAASTAMLDGEATNPDLVSLSPARGRFVWRFSHIPSQLAANWSPGAWDAVVKGAVMAFEADHGLTVDGEPGPKFYDALVRAVAARDVSSRPYDYVIVTETLPETLYVWSDGRVVIESPANTGVPGATTALGTFPVYLRFTSTTMSGTNPDGTHYDDPGVPWVSYFNGSDAVHGFVRPVYGVPQSDGCVELPVATAAEVFPYDTYGTLVTVTVGSLSAELGVAPPTEIAGISAPAPAATPTTTPPTTTSTSTTVPPRRHPVRPHPTTTTTTATTTTTTTTTTVPAPTTATP